MNIAETPQIAVTLKEPPSRLYRVCAIVLRHAAAGALALLAFYLSMFATSIPVPSGDRETIGRAINVLEDKGFSREAFLLRHAATFRSSDNWLNASNPSENAYAATNFPFEIITVYPDFYDKTRDDTERAMILLHESQHLQGADDHQAYEYVWRNRGRLGWTTLSHGTTPVFVTVELQTRENVPELFSCAAKVWNDCTETLQARR